MTTPNPQQSAPAPAPAPEPGNSHAAVDLPNGQEPLPEPVEIDIGGDEAAPPPAAAPTAPPVAPTAEPPPAEPGLKLKPGRSNTAIQNLRQQVQERDQEIARRDQAFQEVMRGVNDLTERERRANIVAFQHMEAGLIAQEKLARYELEKAVETGDAKLQAEAQANLSAIQTQKVQVDSFKRTNPQAFQVTRQPAQPQPQQPQAQQPQRQAQPQQPQVNPATVAWIGANPWFNPEHDDFNEEMHVAAAQFAARLERRYLNEGRANQIATPAYFREVEQFMQREFPDDFEPAAATPPARNGGAPTVPSARTPPPGTPQGKAGARITLTGEERQLARQMARNGAIRNPDGSRMSDQQAEVYYAKYKAADTAGRSN